MTLRYLPPSKILRDRAWEKEFGIDDLQMLAYIHDDSFTVIGQIQAKEITLPLLYDSRSLCRRWHHAV